MRAGGGLPPVRQWRIHLGAHKTAMRPDAEYQSRSMTTPSSFPTYTAGRAPGASSSARSVSP